MNTDRSRRALLRGLAVAPFVVTGFGVATRAARAEALAAGLIAPNACILSTEVTEGPYYIDPDMVRSDITEGKPGVPMDLQLQVVDTACQPIEGARVDLWHCDAEGNYSGYASQGSDQTVDTTGKTFLRGTQMTDSMGISTFRTIYPGWYRGRTTHIHYKVWLDQNTLLTSQIFFPDALSEYLFRSVAPYNDRSATRDTVNSNDSIAQDAGDGAFAYIREQPDRYVAALVVGVSRDARSTTGMGGAMGAPAGGRPPAGGPGESLGTATLVPGQG
ncbi:MAG: protocatechuate dioxygenase [Rhodobacteraceae bacterium]|nr:protocatechuate dioxygenase [Paracoccaceae bacterium]MAY46907.1 protocatechuate dioxygenase [Paracoccaceae bacterium]